MALFHKEAGTSGSGGTSVGGGNNTYNNIDHFTATVVSGEKKITITGCSFTIEAKHVVAGSIIKIALDGTREVLDLSNVTVSANVITLSGIPQNFVSTDQVLVVLIGNDKAYNTMLDVEEHSVMNPDYDHYTDTEHIVDLTNIDAGTYRIIVNMGAYTNLLTHVVVSGGVTVTAYATLDETADNSSDSGWVDQSTAILGAASVVDTEAFHYCIDKKPERIMYKIVTSDATNAIDIRIKRWY
jgi:hypothetical protein